MSTIEEGEYKENPLLIIRSSLDDKYPFAFGLRKAKLILAHIPEIEAFVNKHEVITPKPIRQKTKKKTTKKEAKKVSTKTLLNVTQDLKGTHFKLNVGREALEHIVQELMVILATGKPSC